ncbi:MAG: deoxyribose-phosphate aldolase [Phycisphaerae bacterium]
MRITAEALAGKIDHTLLKPEATSAEIDSLCDEATEHGFATVCVNPIYVVRAARRLASSASNRRKPGITSVVGFPFGATSGSVKEEEARRAVSEGATEIDLVIHIGGLIDGAHRAIRAEIEAVARIVHRADPPGLLKVILETAALTDAQIIAGCRACAEGEADFVKTSTGLHRSGGATLAHVRLLHRCASPLRVKAAGGIRSAEAAQAMIEAGAARIGTSASVAIIGEQRASR